MEKWEEGCVVNWIKSDELQIFYHDEASEAQD